MALLQVRWRAESLKAVGCPAVMLEGDDASPVIVAGTTEGYVVALDGAGATLWRTHVGGSISAWPVVDDVPGIGPSVLVGSESGRVACLSSAGAVRWVTDIEGALTAFNSVAVVRGGGDVALAATDRRGRITGLAATGRVLWRFHAHGSGFGPAAIGDLDGDGADEIVASSGDGTIYCLAADGSFRWAVPSAAGSEYSVAVLAQIGGARRALVGSVDDLLRCIAEDGTVVWATKGRGAGYIEIGISLADIDGDGADEIVFVYQGRAIQAVNGAGQMLWSCMDYGGGDQAFGPSIADIDGDGKLEYLLPQRRGPVLRVLRADGTLMEAMAFPASLAGAPVVADVDGDGRLEALAVGLTTGELVCFETPGTARPGAVPWPTSRGAFDGRANRLPDVRRTKRPREMPGDAALHRASPRTLGLGKNDIAYMADSQPAGSVIEVSLTGPDAVVHRGVQREPGEPIRLEVADAGPHAVTATLAANGLRRALGVIEEPFRVVPFADELLEARRLLDELDVLLAGSPDRHALAHARRVTWNDIDARAAGYKALPLAERRRFIGEVAAAMAALRREVACQRGRHAAEVGTDRPVEYLPWLPEHPWAAFDPAADAPPEDGLVGKLDLLTDMGGHEAAAIEIANILPRPLDIRAWLETVKDADGRTRAARDHFELRQVTWVPATTGTRETEPSGRMGADALPDLGEGGILRIASSAAARLWIDVATGTLPAGTYTTTLHLRALTPLGATWDIPISWTVAPVALPAQMPLKFCNWAYVNSSALSGYQDAALADMQDHYTSVFVLGGDWTPAVRYDADGKLVAVDWRKHAWPLERLRPGAVLLFPGNVLSPADGAPGMWSEPWKKAFAAFLPLWTEFLRQRGFGYDRWAFYPVDEPGIFCGSLIFELERYARFVKGIDPHVCIYTDPYRGYTVEDYTRTIDVLDILQPAYHVLTSPNPDRVEHLKSIRGMPGKRFWIYEAQAGVKDMPVPTTYYWGEIWTAWELGFTGIGYWTYCTGGADLWSGAQDYVLIYPGATKPVPSARWQAVRIGIEDYARLARLRDAIAHAREAGRTTEAAFAERRLEEIAAEAHAARWDPALVAGIRRDVIDMTVRLGA